MAEFLGAVVVIGFGLAVNSQVAISDGKAGDVMTVSLAWGVAVLMGVYTAENVSGAHIISVVTFTHAIYGRMPWWKMPGYMFAQTLGAFVAAALVYVLHYENISAGDLKTMHFLFVTYPHDVSNYIAFYTEVLLCAFLMSCVYAITDQRNRCPGPVGTPFALALLVMALVSMTFSKSTTSGQQTASQGLTSSGHVAVTVPASKFKTIHSSVDSSFVNSCQAILEEFTGQYDRNEDHHEQWFVTRSAHVRECLTEFLGTFVMICFGMGVNNQVVLSGGENGTWLSINMAWGIAVLMGVYCSEGVSGAHMNCAVSFAHAVYGRLPWWKLPGYCTSQVLGAFLGACAIYLLDYQKLMKADPNKETTQANFATYPSKDINNLTAFYSEALATCMLLLCIYAITDHRNRSPGTVGTPFAFALMIMALGMSFGMNTGYAMNPARDFGPRLFTYMVGYGTKVWTADGYYFLTRFSVPLLAALLAQRRVDDVALILRALLRCEQKSAAWLRLTPMLDFACCSEVFGCSPYVYKYVYSNARVNVDYQDAALACLMWYCFGRSSVLGYIKKQHVSVSADGIFYVRLLRVKTAEEQGPTLVPDKADFLTCPIHALAVALATQDEPCGSLLSQLPDLVPAEAAASCPGIPLAELLEADSTSLSFASAAASSSGSAHATGNTEGTAASSPQAASPS
ncbi:putative aquaporin [Phytophthora cinnamomi]|uniref:putative aquaporin n=1 Tax=Phytophthora cinnamomi TaxID=4785 RepID=UPI00355A7C53|nr:putative aquaporin [Phytophthora cinnamomi]